MGNGAAGLTREAVRRLASQPEGRGPIVSLLLNVDGRRHPRPQDYQAAFDRLRRGVDATDADAIKAMAAVEGVVRARLDRSHVRGLAVFAGPGMVEVLHLPLPVRDRLSVGPRPQVRQLQQLLDDHKRFGVLVADRQRARMFVVELGEVVDYSELFEQLPRGDDEGGHRDFSTHHRDHIDVVAHRHLRRAADVAFRVFQDRRFDHLILGAPQELVGDLERELHSYLRERIAARLPVPTNASDDAVRQSALAVEEDVERAAEAAVVRRLRDAHGAGNAAAGLPDVLAALGEHRVDTLVVAEDFEAEGWRCDGGCLTLAARGPACPVCEATMTRVPDVVEEAVEEALNQSSRVEFCTANADLDVLGRVGALLRY